MFLQHMSTGVEPRDACPICSARIKLVEVEPHPNHNELEIHSYGCASCGPIMSVIVRRSVEDDAPLLMLM
jgi:C4-type Zn-finger protein